MFNSEKLLIFLYISVPIEPTNFITITKTSLSQVTASIFIGFIFFSFPGLYAMLVCVACSQLEKLRAAILDIRQTHVTSEQDCGAVTDRQEGQGQGQGQGQVRTSEELFGHMQKQLNNCIRHHQQIIRCDYN
jgi:hypothetical protein